MRDNRQAFAELIGRTGGRTAAIVDVSARFSAGGAVFDVPAEPESLWGEGPESLFAFGEPSILYGPTGLGKTTVAQRVALAAIGIGDNKVLGYPVDVIDGRVLYIAADRPRQAMRSLRRMVANDDRAVLDDRWRWEHRRSLRITPERPEAIYDAAVQAGAVLVIVDSIKDVVSRIGTEEAGQAFNDAAQICVANGVEIVALHHPRKATSEGRTSLTIDDVYGSTWLTAGVGSVIALEGTAGQGIVKLRHLKTPSEPVGPFDIDVDYEHGTITTLGRRDLLEWALERDTFTTADAIKYSYSKPTATETEKKRVRRKLARLAADGYLKRTNEIGLPSVWTAELSHSLSPATRTQERVESAVQA